MRSRNQKILAMLLLVGIFSLTAAEVAKPAEAVVPLWLAKKAFNAVTASVAKTILEAEGYTVFEKPWWVPVPKVLWYVTWAARTVY